MTATQKALESLKIAQPKFLNKGGLCVGLVITQTAHDKGLPLDARKLTTLEKGQVAGLGKAAVQNILEKHGIKKVLAEEGGRTSRGSLGLMQAYVSCLNKLHKAFSYEQAMDWWINRVKEHFASEGPKFNFDLSKSLQANIDDLLDQAVAIQDGGGGTKYLGATLQHLVGAKLDLILGKGKVIHHGHSVADAHTSRKADFHVESTAIHVTTFPSEALIKKCETNIQDGLKPLIITLGEVLQGTEVLIKSSSIKDRVDILDAGPFLAANILEHSLFDSSQCKKTLQVLLTRYNEIVERCETDPGLKIQMQKPPKALS